MTEASRTTGRFCPGCGERAATGAKFCVNCGQRLAGSVASGGPSFSNPGVLVLVGFLAVGLMLWVTLLSPGKAPERMPLAPRGPQGAEGAPAMAGPAASTGEAAMPPNHPPLEVPADVKKFVAELAKDAAAKPKDLEAWKKLAQVQYRAGQVDRSYLSEAEESFRHILELDAKDLDAFRGLGNVHFDREEYAQSVDWYTKYLAVRPEDMNVRTDLGTMYLYGGQADQAIAEYNKVLAKDPKFYQAHYNLGIAYAQGGDKAKALDSLGKAAELAPDEATKKQIVAMIDHANSPGEATAPDGGGSTAPKAAAAGGFQAMIEDNLRGHPIVGPKIVKFEWPSQTAGKVRLRDFPMQAMPEMVRTKFLDRLKSELADAKKKTSSSGAASLDLVDDQSGNVMATVTAP